LASGGSRDRSAAGGVCALDMPGGRKTDQGGARGSRQGRVYVSICSEEATRLGGEYLPLDWPGIDGGALVDCEAVSDWADCGDYAV